MPAAKPDPAIALGLPEFSTLLGNTGPFETKPVLAIALSGGCDSMALTLLAHAWAKQRGGKAIALTVDHHLRPESSTEARQVAQWCRDLNIEHHTLEWHPPSPLPAVQTAARDARYKLLTYFCRHNNILHLLTAHQLEDQGETFFFRLARGSGLSGLACMAPQSEIHGIRLLRPLLSIPKARLKATLAERSQPWIEDPSNQKPIYTRNRIRRLLMQTRAPELLHAQVFELTGSLMKFRNLLEYKLASYLTDAVSLYPEGYGMLHKEAFLSLPEEMGLRVLSATTTALSGTTEPHRSEKLQRLYSELTSKTVAPKRSFGGLLFIHRAGSHWLVCREPKSIQQVTPINAAKAILWDKRFTACWTGPDTEVTLRALGADGCKNLQKEENELLSKYKWAKLKMVLASVPSFWHLEKMIAIPYINYVHKDYQHYCFSTRFTPAKPLAGLAFASRDPLTA